MAEEEPRYDSGFPPWARVRVGLLLVFIGSCVLAGAFALELVGYLMLTINTVQLMSGSHPTGVGEVGRVPTFWLVFRIAEPVSLAAAITCLAGYVLCLLGPRQRGALPLAVIAVSLGTLYLLLALIVRLRFLFGGEEGVAFGAFGRGQAAVFWVFFTLLLASLFFGAQLVLFPFYMRSVASIRKKYRAAGACLVPAILAIAFTVLRVLGWLLFYLPSQTQPAGQGAGGQTAARVWVWTDIAVLWIGNIVFVIFLVFYLLVVWRVRRVATKQSLPG
jgi:hypothetical protein